MEGLPFSLTPVGSDGFTPIPIKQVLGQILIKRGDIGTAMVQAALADTNHNNIFDTAKEYKTFNDNIEKANASYHKIDYSALKPSPRRFYDD